MYAYWKREAIVAESPELEALRLIEEREAKLQVLRVTLDAAVERGGSQSDDDVAAAIRVRLDDTSN